MFNYLRTLAVKQLQNLDTEVRLVILHPNYTQQHLIMGELLGEKAVYVRFQGADLSQPQLHDQLESALERQTGDKQLKHVNGRLILDECDRASANALDEFLPEILLAAPSSQVFVFTRQIPQCCVNHTELRRQTSFIPNDKSFMLWDYARLEDDLHLLEVRSFGEGRVLLNGQSVSNWDGVLPRSLFFYLVDRGMTTRNDIFETFWPNLSVREATNVFHVTKRKISEVLGIDLTTYWSGFYRISPNIELSYDVVLFNELVQNSAIASPEEAVDQLSRAIALYQGHFLYAMDMEWANERRQQLSQDYAEALAGLAKAKEELGHKEEALGLYLRAAANNRHREDLVSSIMELYREFGMYDEALASYARLSEDLQTELGVSPAPQLQQLAESIRQEMS